MAECLTVRWQHSQIEGSFTGLFSDENDALKQKMHLCSVCERTYRYMVKINIDNYVSQRVQKLVYRKNV